MNGSWTDILGGGWQPEHDVTEESPGLSEEELARRQERIAAGTPIRSFTGATSSMSWTAAANPLASTCFTHSLQQPHVGLL